MSKALVRINVSRTAGPIIENVQELSGMGRPGRDRQAGSREKGPVSGNAAAVARGKAVGRKG